jgi:hypothetical protein
MKHITFTLLLMQMLATGYAQPAFISSGFIEYERRMNQFSFYDKEDDESIWIQEMKKTFPKVVSDLYHLYFNSEKTVYKLGAENSNNKYVWGRKPGDADVIVRNVNSNSIAI